MEALKTIKLLFIGKLEKGAVTKSSKMKSINERWFDQKTKQETFRIGNECNREQENLFIQRDSLICLRSEWGGSKSIEFYCVLSYSFQNTQTSGLFQRKINISGKRRKRRGTMCGY